MIVKTKFLCKSGSRQGNIGGTSKWVDIFIEGKWYDGEYETWNSEDGYRLNNGWRKYWVINELGIKKEITKNHMRVIFENDINTLRDEKIKQIIE